MNTSKSELSNFNAKLLPESLTFYKLGDIVEWDGILHKNFDFEYKNIVEHLIVDDSKKQHLISKLEDVVWDDTQINQITLNSSNKSDTAGNIPNYAESLASYIGYDRFLDFRMEDIKSKSIPDELKEELNLLIEQSNNEKTNNGQQIKQLFIIKKLYYARKASIKIANTSIEEIHKPVLKSNLIKNPQLIFKNDSHVEIFFDTEMQFPIAAEIDTINNIILKIENSD